MSRVLAQSRFHINNASREAKLSMLTRWPTYQRYCLSTKKDIRHWYLAHVKQIFTNGARPRDLYQYSSLGHVIRNLHKTKVGDATSGVNKKKKARLRKQPRWRDEQSITTRWPTRRWHNVINSIGEFCEKFPMDDANDWREMFIKFLIDWMITRDDKTCANLKRDVWKYCILWDS